MISYTPTSKRRNTWLSLNRQRALKTSAKMCAAVTDSRNYSSSDFAITEFHHPHAGRIPRWSASFFGDLIRGPERFFSRDTAQWNNAKKAAPDVEKGNKKKKIANPLTVRDRKQTDSVRNRFLSAQQSRFMVRIQRDVLPNRFSRFSLFVTKIFETFRTRRRTWSRRKITNLKRFFQRSNTLCGSSQKISGFLASKKKTRKIEKRRFLTLFVIKGHSKTSE